MTSISDRLLSALGGSYTIERELTGGGMALVFLGEDYDLGRKVVIKILPPELAASVSAERFRREILTVARLQHPHIVPILKAGEVDGLPYFVMPYVDGESIDVKLRRSRTLSVRETLGIMKMWRAHWRSRTSTASCTATSSPGTFFSLPAPRP